jgi:hypothetical protein
MRQLAFDVFAGADKVLGIVVVLFNTGRHGEDIRVKDNIFRREAHLFGEILYARRQISILRSRVSAWPTSSKAITTTAAP